MSLFQKSFSVDVENIGDADTQLKSLDLSQTKFWMTFSNKFITGVLLSPRRREVSSFLEKCKNVDLSICKHVLL